MSTEGAGGLFLKPGQIVVSSQPLLVTTLLGSCVAVTMFCARLKTGGICHAQLPTYREREEEGQTHPGRFMDSALTEMLARLLERGALAGELEVKIFGGSDMFQGRGRGRAVGRQNAEMALTMLARESIKVVNQDLFGERGRKIIFHTHTGAVFLKRLNRSGVC
ncbi:chemotaxis protein CheD [Geomonas edaphica]|uniref:chemotaxis protein CheD n=1 Tax=Geomonas edaphica TaxID=2570226 RepID=UPI0010A7DEA1|nr:chemotaxis protein CheD [Geomonas edaphica]